MKHSITRGLAVSAVSALAVTGLTLVATPAATAAGPDVDLLTQFTGFASLRNDGTGTGNRLTASVGNPDATVTYQVNPDPEALAADPGWREIGTLDGTPQTVGSYSTVPWYGRDIDNRSYLGERVALRATAIDTDGTSYSVRNDVEVSADGAVDSVSITTTGARYFTQPYASSGRTSSTIPVSGATSATSGTVELSSWRQEDGTFTGQTAAEITKVPAKYPTPDNEGTGRFLGMVDLTPFDMAAGVAAVAAERGSDDVVPIGLISQELRTITATAQTVRSGETSDVTIRVFDQDGQPVLGAEVRRLSDTSLVGYTDMNGVVTTTQPGDDVSEEYYANATDLDAFSSDDGDPTSGPVSVATYEPEPAFVLPSFTDGQTFDVDEYASGDIAMAVYDQNSRAVGAGESVSYKIYPVDGEVPDTYSTALTNDDGVAVVDFDTTDASGGYIIAYVLTDQVDTAAEEMRGFTTGQATLLLSPKAAPVVAPAGGQVDYFGRLLLDGEPLPGRLIDLSYDRGVEVVPGNEADASIVTDSGRRLATSVTTNRNGSFRVTVDDSAESPQASEIGGVLTAATGDTIAPVVEPSDEEDPLPPVDGNADTDRTSTTRFGSGEPGTAAIVLSGVGNGARADELRVTGPTSLAGESIEVFRVNARGTRLLVTTRTLDATGDQPRIRVADRNGSKRTTYVVELVGSQRVNAADSNPVTLR